MQGERYELEPLEGLDVAQLEEVGPVSGAVFITGTVVGEDAGAGRGSLESLENKSIEHFNNKNQFQYC